MCTSSPNIQAPPPPAQDQKDPDTAAVKKKRAPSGAGGGTILTGTGGVQQASLNTGTNTLLGG